MPSREGAQSRQQGWDEILARSELVVERADAARGLLEASIDIDGEQVRILVQENDAKRFISFTGAGTELALWDEELETGTLSGHVGGLAFDPGDLEEANAQAWSEVLESVAGQAVHRTALAADELIGYGDELATGGLAEDDPLHEPENPEGEEIIAQQELDLATPSGRSYEQMSAQLDSLGEAGDYLARASGKGSKLALGVIASGYEAIAAQAMHQAGGTMHQTILWENVEYELGGTLSCNGTDNPCRNEDHVCSQGRCVHKRCDASKFLPGKVVRSPSSNPATCYNWSNVDRAFDGYTEGASAPRARIKSVRVLGKQPWSGCKSDKVKACPPQHLGHFKNFVAAATKRYGPGTEYSVHRWMLWNEPNVSKAWGVPDWGQPGSRAEANAISEGAREYAALLVHFRDAARSGNSQVKIHAGEIALAQSNSTEPNLWTRVFLERAAKLENAPGGRKLFDGLTVHPFSRTPRMAAEKVKKVRVLLKKHGLNRRTIGVTAFGWSVGEPAKGPDGKPKGDGWKCVPNEKAQAAYFLRSLRGFRRVGGVGQVVWFNLMDNDLSSAGYKDGPACINRKNYGDAKNLNQLNNYGLFRRNPNGTTDTLAPRVICNKFRRKAGHSTGSCTGHRKPSTSAQGECGCTAFCKNGTRHAITATIDNATQCDAVARTVCTQAGGLQSYAYQMCR
jgi:hypothetical protein